MPIIPVLNRSDSATLPLPPADEGECAGMRGTPAEQPAPGYLRIVRPESDARRQDSDEEPIPVAPPGYPSRSLAVVAVIGAALAQVAIYSAATAAFLRTSASDDKWFNSMFFVFSFGLGLGVPVLSKALGFLRRRTEEKPGRSRTAALPLAGILAAAVLMRLYGTNPWGYGFLQTFLATAGIGIVASGMFMLFFSAVPPGKRGLWFGAGLGFALVCWRIVQTHVRAVADAADVAGAMRWFNVLFTVQTFTLTAIAGLVVYGMARCAALPAPPASEPLRRIGVRRLSVTFVLFYLAAGFMGARLLPAGPNQDNSPEFWQLHILTALACPLFGLFLDRARGGAKTLLLACSVFLLIAPVLNTLGASPFLYSGILAVGTLAQFAVLITATLAFAGLGASPAWYGVAFLLQSLLRLSVYLVYFLDQRILALDNEASMVAALILAICFHFAVRSLDKDGGGGAVPQPEAWPDAPAAGRSAAPAGAGASGDAAPLSSRVSAICGQYSLSKREGEVLEALAAGKDGAEIARQLYISEHTVKTHLRNIMRKVEVSGRTALLLKLLQEG